MNLVKTVLWWSKNFNIKKLHVTLTGKEFMVLSDVQKRSIEIPLSDLAQLEKAIQGIKQEHFNGIWPTHYK